MGRGSGNTVHTAVLGARRAPDSFGGWEYRVRWRDWEGGDTWTTAHALGATPNSALARELAVARERKYTPHSLRAHLESLATHGTATGRARAELLLRACGEDDADNGAMGEVFDAYVRHAARLNGGEGVAERAATSTSCRGRGDNGASCCRPMLARPASSASAGWWVCHNWAAAWRWRSAAVLASPRARHETLRCACRATCDGELSAREAVEAEGAAIAEDAVRAMEGLPPAARPGMWWWTSDVVEITREVLVFPGSLAAEP